MDDVQNLIERLKKPQSYFVGKDWGELLLPRQVLCFGRTHEAVTGSWQSLASSTQRYDQHKRFVLIYALRGSGQVAVETNLWNLMEGECMLIFPYEPHHYGEMGSTYSWLFITFEIAAHSLPLIQDLRGSPRTLSTSLKKRLAEFLKEWSQAQKGEEILHASHRLGSILLDTRRMEPTQNAIQESELVRGVRERVMGNLRGDLSVAALAKHFEVSQSHLREHFRDNAGISLGHFVRSVRLMHALELLRETKLSVGEIALQSGFGSIAVFSRAFAQVYEKSPSAFRKSMFPSKIDSNSID